MRKTVTGGRTPGIPTRLSRLVRRFGHGDRARCRVKDRLGCGSDRIYRTLVGKALKKFKRKADESKLRLVPVIARQLLKKPAAAV